MKKRKRVWGILFVICLLFSAADYSVFAQSVTEAGGVAMGGNPSFDADELFDETSFRWDWFSTQESRMAILPKENLSSKDFHLDWDLFVGMNDKKVRDFQSVTLGGQAAQTMDYQWKPYGLIYQGAYEGEKSIAMTEFFEDKNSLVRCFEINGASGEELTFQYDGKFKHSGTQDTVEVTILDDGSVLMEGPDYYYLSKIMLLDESSKCGEILRPEKEGTRWSVRTTCGSDHVKIASTVTLAVKHDDPTDKTVKERSAIFSDYSVDAGLQKVKTAWNERLSKVPAPAKWGIQELDAKGVTERQHQQSFYAAWTFLYMACKIIILSKC